MVDKENLRTTVFHINNISYGSGKHLSDEDLAEVRSFVLKSFKESYFGSIKVTGIGKEYGFDIDKVTAKFKQLLFQSNINLDHFLNFCINLVLMTIANEVFQPDTMRIQKK